MALIAMLMLLVVLVLVSGQDARAEENTIVGTWFLEEVGVDCTTGVVTQTDDFPIFKDLRTFIPRGTLIQTNGTFSFRSPAHGIWQRTTGQHYITKYTSFAFDADKNSAGFGTPNLRREVEEHFELSKDSNILTGTISIKFFQSGLEFCSDRVQEQDCGIGQKREDKLINTGCAIAKGVRLSFSEE